MSHNRLIERVGFKLDSQNKVVEFLPENEQYDSIQKRRAIFFNLYNYYVTKEMRLSKTEIKNGSNIYEVFQNKIKSLACCTLNFSCVTRTYIVNSYCNSIDLKFIKGCNKKIDKELKLQKRFLQLLVNKELFFDLNDMFLHLVYERAKKVNSKATVHLLEKSILIVDHRAEVSSTLLIPSYMKFEHESINSNITIKEQMKETCKNLNENERVKQVYLIYPKHPKFSKHINVDLHDKVNLREEEYRVKMIPYSFSFCTDRQNKHKN